MITNNKRDATIFRLREDKKLSFAVIAKKFGLSQTRVRQIYVRMANKYTGVGG